MCLRGIALKRCIVPSINFARADLREADLRQAEMFGGALSFVDADLRGAKMDAHTCDYYVADFTGAICDPELEETIEGYGGSLSSSPRTGSLVGGRTVASHAKKAQGRARGGR